MKDFFQKNRRDLLLFLAVFAGLLLRIIWFGPEYYLQLDDYIHYRAYPAGTNFFAYCLKQGLFASRPFAAISDFLFWAKLPHFAASVLLSAMHAGAVALFLRLFRRLFGTGMVFAVVFALIPMGMEATYWQAAATRILPPLLLCAMSLTFFDRFCRENRKPDLLWYLLLAQLAFCFYEQMLVLTLALGLMLALVHVLSGTRRAAWGLLILLPAGIYFLITGYFGQLSSGVLTSRMALILPNDPDYMTKFLPDLMNQLNMAFLEAGSAILSKGFVRGLRLIGWGLLPMGAVLGLVWFTGRSSGSETGDRPGWMCPVFALLAALAPITPFFVIDNPWFSLRNTYAVWLGLALLLDWLLRLLLRRGTRVVSVILAAFFLIVSVSELYDYRDVSRHNQRTAQAVIEADEAYDLSGKVGILNMSASYAEDINYSYHAHICSAHSGGWSLEGAVRYFCGGRELGYKPVPLPADETYYWTVWNRTIRDVTIYDTLLYYDFEDNRLVPLTVEAGEGEWLLFFEDGVRCARIWTDVWGAGFIEFDTAS